MPSITVLTGERCTTLLAVMNILHRDVLLWIGDCLVLRLDFLTGEKKPTILGGLIKEGLEKRVIKLKKKYKPQLIKQKTRKSCAVSFFSNGLSIPN